MLECLKLTKKTSLSIVDTVLANNKADFGGVLWTQLVVVKIHNVTVFGNQANTDGGVCHTEQTEMVITGVACHNGSVLKWPYGGARKTRAKLVQNGLTIDTYKCDRNIIIALAII